MCPRRPTPEPVIIQTPPSSQSSATSQRQPPDHAADPRWQEVEDFLQTLSVSERSRKAYRQDLRYFLNWTSASWMTITPHHVTQFKAYLMRADVDTGARVLQDATVRRILGTLKKFYQWMETSQGLPRSPAATITIPTVHQANLKGLSTADIDRIYQAASQTSLPERNVALISVLLHGLKVGEVSRLNVHHYRDRCVWICGDRPEEDVPIPLMPEASHQLDRYLDWRQGLGDPLDDRSPLFASHSRRNGGQRLGYDGIRKFIKTLEAKTGLPNLHAYQFRHTFTANLVQQGMNSAEIMMRTRHRSPASLYPYKQ